MFSAKKTQTKKNMRKRLGKGSLNMCTKFQDVTKEFRTGARKSQILGHRFRNKSGEQPFLEIACMRNAVEPRG